MYWCYSDSVNMSYRTTTIRIPETTAKALELAARTENISVSEAVRNAIEKYIDIKRRVTRRHFLGLWRLEKSLVKRHHYVLYIAIGLVYVHQPAVHRFLPDPAGPVPLGVPWWGASGGITITFTGCSTKFASRSRATWPGTSPGRSSVRSSAASGSWCSSLSLRPLGTPPAPLRPRRETRSSSSPSWSATAKKCSASSSSEPPPSCWHQVTRRVERETRDGSWAARVHSAIMGGWRSAG